ncbi:MAG: acyl carrier protein [Bdellovibrionales bacterium]|jgi:acyl carrier protein|nr:acyl carrier protein [Bdellovibrionales bacterium]
MENEVIELLEKTLKLNGRSKTFSAGTRLRGALPELDSLAVAALLTQIEKQFNIRIEDDEIDGSIFATVGALTDFISQKVKSSGAHRD